jgi:hypothetical protein
MLVGTRVFARSRWTPVSRGRGRENLGWGDPTPEVVSLLRDRVIKELMAMFREGARGWAHSDKLADPMHVISGFYLAPCRSRSTGWR